jgi:energy-coupling factor transporter ATP-binding protein EcfA2
MALLDDLLDWSTTLPVWQQVALQRLFTKEDLDETDHNQLLELLKFQHDLVQAPQWPIEPLSAQHLQAGFGDEPVNLLGMSNLRDVNGFPDGRTLTFAPTGLTIVFGENGVGKSGYARVLKSACKARKNETVLANAFAGAGGTPRADIHFQVANAATFHHWEQGKPSHPQLGAVAVYDALCANNYITRDDVPAFQPFGLKHVTKLVAVCDELLRRIRIEIGALPRDVTPYQNLRNQTRVGRLIATLSAQTDLEEITRLGTFPPSDAARLEQLARALLELDPEPKAKALDRSAMRLEGLLPLAKAAASYTTDAAIERLRQYVEASAEADNAQASAAALLKGQGLLPGTGSSLWRSLLNAAEAYSKAEAYPGHQHPYEGDGARCVLCQTTLDKDAVDRLSNFQAFVVSKAQKAADDARTTLDEARGKILGADFTLAIDDALRAEIEETEPELHQGLQDWVAAWHARRDWMLVAAQNGAWLDAPSLPTGAALPDLLANAMDRAIRGAQTLRAAVDPIERQKLMEEHNELVARKQFSPLADAVAQVVRNMQTVKALEALIPALGTGSISRKATELADKHISATLLTGLKEELSKLGYKRTITQRIPINTNKGVSKVHIALQGTSEKTEAVLSEGEQRATALAFFLAEMRLAPAKSSLVFDDPVTSMDHHFRRDVARRLVEIAQERQVIVFTHDAIFVTALHRACGALEHEPAYRRIEWDTRPGSVSNTLGWQEMPVASRLNALEAQLAEMKKTWEEYPSEASKTKMANAYSDLRGTIERLIREIYLRNALEAYGDEVNVREFYIAAGGVEPAELDVVMAIYDRACGAMTGHDTPIDHQIPLPTPEVLNADLEALRAAIKATKIRAQEREAMYKIRRNKLKAPNA